MPREPSGKREEGGSIRDAQMAGGRKLEPAADGRAVQRRDGRNAPVTDHAEDAMPGPRMVEHLLGGTRLVLDEIEPGAEARPIAVEHEGARLFMGAPHRRFDSRRSAHR